MQTHAANARWKRVLQRSYNYLFKGDLALNLPQVDFTLTQG